MAFRLTAATVGQGTRLHDAGGSGANRRGEVAIDGSREAPGGPGTTPVSTLATSKHEALTPWRSKRGLQHGDAGGYQAVDALRPPEPFDPPTDLGTSISMAGEDELGPPVAS
jgi:hypothetical protein